MKILIALPFLAFNFATSTPVEEPALLNTSEPTTSETSETTTVTEGEFNEGIKSWVSQYVDSQFIMNIINWAIDAGLLTGLFAIYLKYRKYKSLSSGEIATKVKEEVKKELGLDFEGLSNEKIKPLEDRMAGIETKLDTQTKVMILSHDKSAEGKKAMLSLLKLDASDEVTNKLVDEETLKIEKEQKAKEAVADKVKDDYNPIF